MKNPNRKQIGGQHYKSNIEHWDFIVDNNRNYLEGCATKYLSRWRYKNGVQDLQKAEHYVEKLIHKFETGVIRPPAARGCQFADCKEFCFVNKIKTEFEYTAISLIMNWTNIKNLKTAILLIKKLIQNADTII